MMGSFDHVKIYESLDIYLLSGSGVYRDERLKVLSEFNNRFH